MSTSPESASTLARRYADVWNEPDDGGRRAAVAELWHETGVEYLESAQYRGHDELTDRVAGAHGQFVASGNFRFVSADDAVAHHDGVTFRVHMVPADGGPPVWTGIIFLVLGSDGLIRHDYQFTGPEAATRATVTAFLQALAGGDPDAIADVFAETVDWQLDWPEHGHPDVPWIRPRATRSDVADHFRELDEVHDPGERGGTAPRVLVEGADAVLLGRLVQTVRSSGREYQAMFALHLTVEDGLITRYHVYEDSLTVAQAMRTASAEG